MLADGSPRASIQGAMPRILQRSLADEIRLALKGQALAVLLYGSRARGRARPDSDVDVLQIVEHNPRSYSVGRVNVAAYTAEHLRIMAARGSLFVRHLRDEATIIDDPSDVMREIFSNYSEPDNYETLKREMAIVMSAADATDVNRYAKGMFRAVSFAVRTAVYIRTAERGSLTFDTELACEICDVIELAPILRERSATAKIGLLSAIGLNVVDGFTPRMPVADLPSIALWSHERFPLASRLLEAVIAGETQIDYTSITLPLV